MRKMYAAIAVALIVVLVGCTATPPDTARSSTPAAVTSDAVIVTEPATEAAPEPDVSAEWTAALKSAESYIEFTAFSKQGLFDQLTSEYGDQFPDDAAQYAVDNVEVDWNAEALEAAISYRDVMALSSAAIRDQLTAEFGDQFTPEQADYAVTNLP